MTDRNAAIAAICILLAIIGIASASYNAGWRVGFLGGLQTSLEAMKATRHEQ